LYSYAIEKEVLNWLCQREIEVNATEGTSGGWGDLGVPGRLQVIRRQHTEVLSHFKPKFLLI
jgi:hypothetical protein